VCISNGFGGSGRMEDYRIRLANMKENGLCVLYLVYLYSIVLGTSPNINESELG